MKESPMSQRERGGWRPLCRVRPALLAVAMQVATPAAAQDVMATAGDWEYGADSELAAASTRNDQGWLFGLVCSPNCIGFIESDRPCEPGRRYDSIMRSAGREDPVPLECRPLEGRFAMLFTPTPAYIEMLRNGREVTVSVRLGGTADTDFRFSLNGAYDAIYVTLATAIAASGETPEQANPGL
jgi:hypothetical protein